jgi:hypothetical protein
MTMLKDDITTALAIYSIDIIKRTASIARHPSLKNGVKGV